MLTKAQRIIVTFGAWAVFVMATLLVFSFLSLELYFILCLIGFLVIVELSGPFFCRPRWRSRVTLVLVAGILAFLLLVSGKILEILRIRLL